MESPHKLMNSSKLLKYVMWKTSFHRLCKWNMLETLNWEEKGKCRARAKPIFPWYVCKPNILQYLGQHRRQEQFLHCREGAAEVHSRAGRARSGPLFLWATGQCHLLLQGAGCGWQPRAHQQWKFIHCFCKEKQLVSLPAWRWRESTPWLHVFSVVPPQSLLLDYRVLGPACTFSLLKAPLKVFWCSWRPEGWKGMSTPRRVGFLRWLKRKIWSNLKLIKRSRKEGNLRDPETMALQICRWDHLRWCWFVVVPAQSDVLIQTISPFHLIQVLPSS